MARNRSVQSERGSLQKAADTNGLDRAKVGVSFAFHLVSTATIDALMMPCGFLKQKDLIVAPRDYVVQVPKRGRRTNDHVGPERPERLNEAKKRPRMSRHATANRGAPNIRKARRCDSGSDRS